VVSQPNQEEEQVLTAFIVPSPDRKKSEEQLVADSLAYKVHVRNKLPPYMAPTFLCFLDAFPELPNGKVDRRAIQAIHGWERDPSYLEARKQGENVETPENKAEEVIRSVFAQALKIPEEEISVTQSFFYLGGTSAKGMLVVSGCEKVLKPMMVSEEEAEKGDTKDAVVRMVTQQDFLQDPTVRGLADIALGKIVDDGEVKEVVCLQRQGHKTPIFLCPAAGGWAFPYFFIAYAIERSRPVWSFQDPAVDEKNPLPESIEGMAARYLQLMKTVQPNGPYVVGGWSMGGVSAMELARQLVEDGNEVAQVLLFDCDYPADDNKQYANPREWMNVQEMGALNGWVQDGLYLDQRSDNAKERNRQCCGHVQNAVYSSLAAGSNSGIAAHQDELRAIGEGAMRMPSLARIGAMLQVHENLEKAYKVQPYDGCVTIFWAMEGKRWYDTLKHLRRWSAKIPLLQSCEVPGTHASMARNPNAGTLAKLIEIVLDEKYHEAEFDVMAELPGWWGPHRQLSECRVTAAISARLESVSGEDAGLARGGTTKDEKKSGGFWASIKAALNPGGCQERLHSTFVEEVLYNLVVTRVGNEPAAQPCSWVLDRSLYDFEMVKKCLLEQVPPPELPALPKAPVFAPSKAETTESLRVLDTFVRHLVTHHLDDPAVSSFFGTRRKYMQGGAMVQGLDGWEQHWSEKFKRSYYHNRFTQVTVWERPAGFVEPNDSK